MTHLLLRNKLTSEPWGRAVTLCPPFNVPHLANSELKPARQYDLASARSAAATPSSRSTAGRNVVRPTRPCPRIVVGPLAALPRPLRSARLLPPEAAGSSLVSPAADDTGVVLPWRISCSTLAASRVESRVSSSKLVHHVLVKLPRSPLQVAKPSRRYEAGAHAGMRSASPTHILIVQILGALEC